MRGKQGQRGVISRDIHPIATVLLRSVGGKPDGGEQHSIETLGKTREKSGRSWTEGWSELELTSADLIFDGCQDSY